MSMISLNFSRNEYLKMLEDEVTEYDFISAVLSSKSENNDSDYKTICFELQSNHADDGGAPEVDDFEISEVRYDRRTKKGTVYLEYEV